jgi:hypothetical protein
MARAGSSAVERQSYTLLVVGSIPSLPTGEIHLAAMLPLSEAFLPARN